MNAGEDGGSRSLDVGRRKVPLNTHVHLPPNFSAFRDTREAVRRASDEGLGVLGASNYYDFAVYAELATRSREAGIVPLFGMEAICYLPDLREAGVRINDPGNPGKMYLCGKGLVRFDPMADEAAARMDVLIRVDGERIRALVERMSQVFADAGVEVRVSVDGVVAAVAERAGVPSGTVHLQERHVAQAFAEALPGALERLTGAAPAALDPVNVQNVLRSQLMKAGKPAYVAEDDAIDFDLVRGLVLALGGIPCYPVLADGASPVCGFESSVADLASWLRAHGVHAAELIPNRNAPDVLTRYVRGLRDAGLVVTAGTEHNTLDMVPMTPVCADGSALPAEVQEVFWEGVCVLAAHQARVGRGEPGFVGADGAPDPTYSSDDERITAWARAGAGLIQAELTRRPTDHAAAPAAEGLAPR